MLPQRGWNWLANQRMAAWAIAALLLVTVGVVLLSPGGNSQTAEAKAYRQALALLEQSRFDEVQQTVAAAARSGIESDRLRSLESEAVRHIPAPIALAYAGRLSDFGYDVGGVVARDPAGLPHRQGLSQAEQILQAASQENLEVVLNRGHALLALDRTAEARAEFDRATRLAPADPLGWLGLGLACFLADDFEAADSAFRQAVSLDPTNVSAGINLAMTLEELDRNSTARAEWRRLLKLPLADADRKTIEAAIEQLHRRNDNPEPGK